MATPSSIPANNPISGNSRRYDFAFLCACFVACALSVLVSFRVFGPARGLISIWPLTAVELAFCITRARTVRRRLVMQMFAASGVVCTGVACHLGWGMIGTVLVLSQIEVCVAQWLLGRTVKHFDDLRQARGMIRFGMVAVACPIGIASVAALPLSLMLHRSLWAITVSSAISDSLGYVTMLPLFLLLFSGAARQIRLFKPSLSTAVPAVCAFLATTAFVFWQTSNPILFLIFPPLLLVVFSLGLEGAVFATSTLTVVGSLATRFGHGPLLLTQAVPRNHALFLLQAFIWIASATALPVGALLGEQRRARRQAQEAEVIYTTLLRNTGDMILLSSIDGSQRYVSPSVTRVLGWTPEEFLSQERFSLLHPEDRESGQNVVDRIFRGNEDQSFRFRYMCKDGSWRWMHAVLRGYAKEKGSAVQGYVATVRDASEQLDQEDAWQRELSQLTTVNRELTVTANTDKLTGLWNRRGLDEAVKKIKSDVCTSLILLDADHFKNYNDVYGHLRGDACLQQLADILRQFAAGAAGSTAIRFGGEEFAILLPNAGRSAATQLGRDILAELELRRIPHEGSPRGFVTMSAGVAVWMHHESIEIATCIQSADEALYQSKRGGRNRLTCAEVRITAAA